MKIAIAHGDRLIREAVRRSFSGGEFTLLWMVADADELRRAQRRDPADLLLLDSKLVGEMVSAASQGQPPSPSYLILAADDACEGVYEALSAGALGHVMPPTLASDGAVLGGARLLSRIARVRALVGNVVKSEQMLRPSPEAGNARALAPILALGASTGGPLALARVLAGLPAGLNAAILLVQHIDGEFSEGLVEWLATHTLLPVQLARRGDLVEAGRVYVGSAQGHLVLQPSGQISYLAARKLDLHVPSVDMLFNSLKNQARPGAAALLTGMGRDGAQGLMELRKAGWFTVAQDEATSTVFGMPRAAIELGAATQTLPLAAIGASLARHIGTLRHA